MNLQFILDKLEISFSRKCNVKVKKTLFFLERKIDIFDFVHNQWKEEPSLKVSFSCHVSAWKRIQILKYCFLIGQNSNLGSFLRIDMIEKKYL